MKDEKFIKKWERIDKKGALIYIAQIALIFIIVAPIVAIFIDLVFMWNFSDKAIAEVTQTKNIISKIIVFTFVGIFTEFSSWNRGQKRYEKLNKN